jgi:hypothetical protein
MVSEYSNLWMDMRRDNALNSQFRAPADCRTVRVAAYKSASSHDT